MLPKKASQLIADFKKHGYECYVVGGYLRNQLLKKETDAIGIDFTTNATPEEIASLCKDAKYENRFGTVIVPLEDGDFFEITTYRPEKNYRDSRHP